MKALLLTYHFPPMLGCCSLRTGALVQSLAEKGWDCHILTAAVSSNDAIYTLDNRIQPSHPRLHIYPISEGRYGQVVQLLRQGTRTSTVPSTSDSGTRPNPSWLATQLKALAIPDSKSGWMLGAYRQVARLLKQHHFDVIYSFGYPWSCHMVGYAAQLKTRAPWVADYADPWTYNPDMQDGPGWRKRVDFHLESRLLRRANAVVVATPEAQSFLGSIFGPAVGGRSHVSRVAQFKMDEYGLPSSLPRESFQIAFTGLFDFTRQPFSFFDALKPYSDKRNIRVCLAGLIGEPFRAYARRIEIEPLLQLAGRIGRQEAIELQMNSHILLSFGWPGGLQVPCKLYEYFAARRPILHVRGDANDPAAALILKHQRGLVVPNETTAISKALLTLYELWAADKLETNFDLSPLDEFCLPRSLEGLMQAFDQVEQHTSQHPHRNLSASTVRVMPGHG